jgi:hypothetical protein
MMQTILAFACVLIPAGFRADEKPADKPKAEPAGTPLELTITGKTTKYTLDTGGLAVEEYRKRAENEAKRGKPLAVPMIDLSVEIKNTSDQTVQIWTSGDPVVLTLTLKGKGALNLDAAVAFTREFRLPKSAEVPAGKSFVIPVKSLMSGFRGRSHVSYWSEPGDYELIATLKTGLAPAPKGAKDGMNGFGLVTLTSAPLQVMVEAKK